MTETCTADPVLSDLSSSTSDRILRRIVLRACTGPDVGRAFTLDVDAGPISRPLRGGRSEVCHLVLSDPRVSDIHFELAPRRDRLLVRDLDSATGVLTGELRLREAWLAPGATFRVGGTTLELVAAETAELPASPFSHLGDLDGQSPAMRLLFHRLAELAGRDGRCHGLFSGEPGTGKTLAAHSLHLLSPDRHGPFVVCDLAAVPHARAAAELFGLGERRGAFGAASGGTLVLKSIDALPLPVQSKLATLLPLAPSRVVATTRRDLQRMAADGLFDPSLHAQLAGFHLVLPPLRERGRDIAFVAGRIVTRIGAVEARPRTLGPDALDALRDHTWPGNVRELRFVLERAYFAAQGPTISRTDLDLGCSLDNRLARVESLLRATHDQAVAGFESIYFRHMIETHRTKVLAARASGMTGEGFRLACRRVQVA